MRKEEARRWALRCRTVLGQHRPYTWPLPCACILMMAGFICREITADKHDADDLAGAVQGLFYSATPTFALPLYAFLICSPFSSELLPWLNQMVSYIIVWAFTTATISCTAQGCSTYFNPDAKASTISSALALLKASLLLQLSLNGAVLCLLVVVLGSKLRKITGDDNAMGHHQSMRTLLFLSFALTVLMVVRNIFRTVQIFASPLSAIWTNEAYFWVFEASVMVCFSTLFHVMHPAKYLSLGSGCGQAGRCG